jgi:hypothetical protein
MEDIPTMGAWGMVGEQTPMPPRGITHQRKEVSHSFFLSWEDPFSLKEGWEVSFGGRFSTRGKFPSREGDSRV